MRALPSAAPSWTLCASPPERVRIVRDEREVGEPDVDERPDALDEVRDERAARAPSASPEREPAETLEELAERQGAELRQRRAADAHRRASGVSRSPRHSGQRS